MNENLFKIFNLFQMIFQSYNKIRGDAQRVRIGTINLQKPSVHMQEIDVGKTIGHPEYSSRNKHNDIGLIKLIKKIIFNEYVHPACINIDEHLKWKTALATGFGRLTYGKMIKSIFHSIFLHVFYLESTDGSTELMKVQLSNIDKKDCKKTYEVTIINVHFHSLILFKKMYFFRK